MAAIVSKYGGSCDSLISILEDIQSEYHYLPGFINLIGIESPGLTSAPAIAKYVEGIVNEIL